MRDARPAGSLRPGARRSGRTPARPALVVLAALLSALLSAAVCAGAVLAPAPAAVVPFVVAVSVGCPVFAGWELPGAMASVRADRAGEAAMRALRRTLAQLPETEHPLGL